MVERRQAINKSISKWYDILRRIWNIKKNQAQRRKLNAKKGLQVGWPKNKGDLEYQVKASELEFIGNFSEKMLIKGLAVKVGDQ